MQQGNLKYSWLIEHLHFKSYICEYRTPTIQAACTLFFGKLDKFGKKIGEMLARLVAESKCSSLPMAYTPTYCLGNLGHYCCVWPGPLIFNLPWLYTLTMSTFPTLSWV